MEAISNFPELFQLNDGGRSLFGMLQEKIRTLKIRDSEDRQIFGTILLQSEGEKCRVIRREGRIR